MLKTIKFFLYSFSVNLTFSYFLFSPAAMAIEPICPGTGSPDPSVIWCEDFESGTATNRNGWSQSAWGNVCCDKNGDGIITVPERDPVVCGNKGYNDDCSAESPLSYFDGTGYDGHYGGRGLQFPAEFYIRWYVYISNPFIWGDVQDKNLRLFSYDAAGNKLMSVHIKTNIWGTGQPDMEEFAPRPKQYYQNQNNDLTLQPGKWYLFEWYVKLNAPGISDGITKLWVDDATVPIKQQTLRLYYTDAYFRDVNVTPGELQLTPYHAKTAPNPSQYVRWDNIVISSKPIGPIGILRSVSPKNLLAK